MSANAVVLAGGDGAVVDPTCRFKGLLPIHGRPMVSWVVDALRVSESVAEIAVVVPSAEDLGAWVDSVDKVVVSDGSLMQNLLAGVDSFRVERPTLITTGDIPALTGEAVDDFIAMSLASTADFTYPLIRREDMLRQFPGSERTFVKLKNGPITGGNMMLVNPNLSHRNREIGQQLFDTRKNAFQMARVIGLRFVAKLAIGRLEVPEVEAKMEQLLGGKSAAIYTEFASIGADVDKPVDVIVAERVIAARERVGNSAESAK